MPYFFELWKWWEVVDIDNFASLVPLHVSTIYSSLHSAPEWHSFPIVTIEGYVWHKCGPDDDEVLHSTSFQAVIENFLKYKKKKKKKDTKNKLLKDSYMPCCVVALICKLVKA